MKRSTGMGWPPMTVRPTTGWVRAGFLTPRLLAEPLLYECRPQGSVRSIRPAVTEEDRPNRVLLARLQHHLLVVRVARDSELARNRVPNTAACAPSARTATKPRPSAMPPAAATGRGATASTIRGTRANVEISPATW